MSRSSSRELNSSRGFGAVDGDSVTKGQNFVLRFTVGGRSLELTQEQVITKLRGVHPEPIHVHLVEVGGLEYPPKQVLAVVTGWGRQSYTTMEAQRVLGRLDFVCRPAGPGGGTGSVSTTATTVRDPDDNLVKRVAALEAGLATAQAAIAGLHARLPLTG